MKCYLKQKLLPFFLKVVCVCMCLVLLEPSSIVIDSCILPEPKLRSARTLIIYKDSNSHGLAKKTRAILMGFGHGWNRLTLVTVLDLLIILWTQEIASFFATIVRNTFFWQMFYISGQFYVFWRKRSNAQSVSNMDEPWIVWNIHWSSRWLRNITGTHKAI